MASQGRNYVNFFDEGGGGGGLCKSWTFYPGQYSDVSKGSTKTE